MNTWTCGHFPDRALATSVAGSGIFATGLKSPLQLQVSGSKVAFLQVVGQEASAMSDGKPLFEKSRSVEDVQQLRLLVLLDETVRDKGIMQAAQDLNVDHRTLAASLESGKLSRRMRGALEKALLEGGGSPAREQRERNDRLEGRVEKLERAGGRYGKGDEPGPGRRPGRGPGAAGAARPGYAAAGPAGRLGRVLRTGRGSPATPRRDQQAPGNTGRRSPPRQRREFPELVTVSPADDDEDVFGASWPNWCKEWREIEGHPPRPGQGTGLAAGGRAGAVGRAGIAGGTRADSAAGDLPVEGPGPQQPSQLAPKGAGGCAEGQETAGVAVAAAACYSPWRRWRQLAKVGNPRECRLELAVS